MPESPIMTENSDQKYCSLCNKELNFWFTSLKKYQGKKICTSCASKLAFKDFNDSMAKLQVQTATRQNEDLGHKISSLGKKLTIGLTFPIIFFVIGILTMPLGIVFWILGLLMFIGMFTKK